MKSKSNAMSEQRNSYKITLSISPEEGNVFFKRDGRRFDSEYTLKLLVDAVYKFTLLVKPSLPLQSVSVMGSDLSMTDLSQQENGASKYTFQWHSLIISANKRNDRTNLQILFRFQDGVSLLLPLQVKFYRATDQSHLVWGTPLNYIEYDCVVKPMATFVDIVNTVLR